MVKILIDHSIFLYQTDGGISKYFWRLYKQLKKKKINIKIFYKIYKKNNLKNEKKKVT